MAKNKKSVKRAIEILGVDKELLITKAVCVDVPKKFVILEEYKEGEYRLTWTKNLIEDMSKVSGFIFKRDE